MAKINLNQELEKSQEHSFEAFLLIKMIGGKNLPAMDRNGKSDPYLIVYFKNQKYKTKVIKKTLNPTWNEEYIVKFTAEDLKNPSETFLLIEAFDWDEGIGGDDEMGYIEFSLKTFLEKPEQQGWYKIKPPKIPEKENEEHNEHHKKKVAVAAFLRIRSDRKKRRKNYES